MSLSIAHADSVIVHFSKDDAADVRQFLASLHDTYKPAYQGIATPPAYGERWAGQGGLYVGTQPAMLGLPARHLIAGVDEIEEITYGSYGQDEPGAASRTDGPANTAALLASKHDHPAAEWAANYMSGGHTDFHLPSQADLFMASLCAPHVFKKEGWYVSSSQNSAYYAFVQDFANGDSYWTDKNLKFRGRAFRWIHLNA